MNKLKKIFNSTFYIFMIFMILLLNINKGFMTLDDTVYQGAFNNISSFFRWIADFYLSWGGRITLLAFVNVFTNLPQIVFKICNSLVFLIGVFAIYKIISMLLFNLKKEHINVYITIIFSSIFFLSIATINSGAIWISGALNYLWPVVFMLLSLIPFIANITKYDLEKKYYIFSIISNIFSCFAEQTSAILIVFSIISMIWSIIEKRKVNKLLILHFVLILVLSLTNLLAPGNSVRSNAEELKWYSSYSMLSPIDKAIAGISNTINHMVNKSTIIVALIVFISSFYLLKDKEIGKVSKTIGMLPAVYMFFRIFPFNFFFGRMIDTDIDNMFFNMLYNIPRFGVNMTCDKAELFKIALGLVMFLIVSLNLLAIFKNRRCGTVISLIFLAAICSSVIMCFSPTIYASGERVFMSEDILLITISSLLCIRLFNTVHDKNKKLAYVFLTGIILIAIVCYANLCVNGLQYIMY